MPTPKTRIPGEYFSRKVTRTSIRDLEYADVTGDEIPDLITRGIDQVSGWQIIEVRIGTKRGGFKTPKRYRFPEEMRQIQVSDIDGDGNADILTHKRLSEELGEIVFLPGDGKGSFGALLSLGIISSPRHDTFKVVDLNNDGRPDVVATPDWGDRVDIYVSQLGE